MFIFKHILTGRVKKFSHKARRFSSASYNLGSRTIGDQLAVGMSVGGIRMPVGLIATARAESLLPDQYSPRNDGAELP
jgi:hypothetical protein